MLKTFTLGDLLVIIGFSGTVISLLLKIVFQTGKVSQQIVDIAKDLKEHDERLRKLEAAAKR